MVLVQNNKGGMSHAVSELQRLRRFLILGSESGTFYASAVELSLQNARAILSMVAQGQGLEVLQEIESVSVEGRAPKQNSTLFALALVCRSEDRTLAKAGFELLPRVCRIPTHLFQFLGYYSQLGEGTSKGWGRMPCACVSQWYLDKDPQQLAYLISKYRQREAWGHADVLRLAHPRTRSEEHNFVFQYVLNGLDKACSKLQTTGSLEQEQCQALLRFFQAVDVVRTATTASEEVLGLIREHRLTHEHLSTKLKTEPKAWQELLPHMPMTALLRNLWRLTELGLLADAGNLSMVVSKLQDREQVRAARLHPLTILNAMAVYRSRVGSGGVGAGAGARRGQRRGRLLWQPPSLCHQRPAETEAAETAVLAALEAAFELSFESVEATGLRYLLALDVSGSMGVACNGTSLSCREAAAAMLMTTLRSERNVFPCCFSHELQPLPVMASDSLAEVVAKTSRLPFGGTDCSLPIQYAYDQGMAVDVFVVYTDSETWSARAPSEVLREYRQASGIDAKLVVVGMASNGFTLADPEDGGMLDVVGFDTAAPRIMADFAMGKL